jgi:hypothetical protein
MTATMRCARKGCERGAPVTTGHCAEHGGQQGRQPDGTYQWVCYLPPTPPAFGRAVRRAREREREAG